MTTSFYILIVALLIMAIAFLVMPLPMDESELKNRRNATSQNQRAVTEVIDISTKCNELSISSFKTSLRIFSFLYAVLSLYCTFKMSYPIDVLGIPFLFAATLQAHLWGIAYLNVLDSPRINRSFIAKAVAQPLVLLLVCFVCSKLFGYHKVASIDEFFYLLSLCTPDLYLRIIWFVYYLSVAVFYFKIFYDEAAEVRDKASDDELTLKRLRFAKSGFSICLFVVLVSIFITLSYDQYCCSIFNLLMLILYVIIGFIIIKSVRCYLYSGEETGATKEDEWLKWRQFIIDKELYAQQGITIVQIARELNTNRTTLSSIINQYEGTNFNSFINGLRISKAQTLIKENPLMQMADVCANVGYTDQANFSRIFKQVTGFSPVAWKQKNP